MALDCTFEDLKTIVRAACKADSGSCVACSSDVLRALVRAYPEKAWLEAAMEAEPDFFNPEDPDRVARLLGYNAIGP